MVGSYRLTGPLFAICSINGHHHALTVPVDSIIDLNGKAFNGDRLMEVIWNHRKILMFTDDLKAGTVPA
jgi:hypothetical protein